MMNVLVTGARGFVGKNLIQALFSIRDEMQLTVFEFGRETDKELLELYCKKADFVFHLAGVNRPKEEAKFWEGNVRITEQLLDFLKRYNNTCPVLFSSSVQAQIDNSYGKSKKAAEDLVFAYGRETGAKVYVYRFPNIFGKWCKPNYNSAIATFCHNIARGLPIKVDNASARMRLVYIDDVVEEMISAMRGETKLDEHGFACVSTEYSVVLGDVVEMIYAFRSGRETREVPDVTVGSLSKKMYATYLSYLPETAFSYPLKMNVDERGSFTEIFRTKERGQFSVNVSKPGITKGEHWHTTKNEKFVVVSGSALIQFRKVGIDSKTGHSYPVIEYRVSGDNMEVVEIPAGYTHNIINIGDSDLITVMWNSDCFDPNNLDTYFLKVEEER